MINPEAKYIIKYDLTCTSINLWNLIINKNQYRKINKSMLLYLWNKRFFTKIYSIKPWIYPWIEKCEY